MLSVWFRESFKRRMHAHGYPEIFCSHAKDVPKLLKIPSAPFSPRWQNWHHPILKRPIFLDVFVILLSSFIINFIWQVCCLSEDRRSIWKPDSLPISLYPLVARLVIDIRHRLTIPSPDLTLHVLLDLNTTRSLYACRLGSCSVRDGSRGLLNCIAVRRSQGPRRELHGRYIESKSRNRTVCIESSSLTWGLSKWTWARS